MLDLLRFGEDTQIYRAEIKFSGSKMTMVFNDVIPSRILLAEPIYHINEMNDSVMDTWDQYTTIYRIIDNTVILSNDGEVYVEPTRDITYSITWDDGMDEDQIRPTSINVVATPSTGSAHTYTLTEANNWRQTINDVPESIDYKFEPEEVSGYQKDELVSSVSYTHTPIRVVRENKITELNSAATAKLNYGADVEMLDGTVQHFNYSTYAQMNLSAAYSSASTLMTLGKTTEKVPFYTSENKCELYYPVEIAKIYLAMGLLLTSSVTLAHQLEQQINSMTDADAINAITLSSESLDEAHLAEFNTIINQTQNIIDIISNALMPQSI